MADEYYPIPAEPQYQEQIRKLQNSDPASADGTFNPLISTLIENTAAVKKQADAARTITGEGAPTTETVGHLGQHYFDTAAGKEYVCTEVSEDGKITWRRAGATDASDLTYNGKNLSNCLDKLSKDVTDSKPLTGSGDPTSSTAGTVGQHYLDTDAGKEYVCVAADEETGTYIWKASGGGIYPRLAITAPTGCAITVSDGIKTFTPIEREGVWEQDVPDFGIYTVTAEIGEETFARHIEISNVKIYSVNFTGFEATIDVFYPEGALITWSIGDKTQSIVSTGQRSITVYEPGTYTVTRNYGGRTVSREIEVTENGSTVPLVLSWRYGYRKKKSESDPYARIEYLYDAVGMKPAHMDYSAGRFDIGDWGDAWFVRKNRPVMQKSDLTEDYELDHNDHTKKLDGSPSDVSNTSYDGNAMSAIPLCWWLRYEEDGYEYYIVCEHQWDDSYKAYAHTRADSSIEDYFYWGMFGGSGNTARIRSLKGQSLAQSITAQGMIDGATANGPGWYIHSWSRRECIRDLLVLMAKTTDTQTAYGNGNCQSASSAAGLLTTGTLSDKGQFWGSTANNQQVKVFYIEGFWGDQWLRTAGIINNKGPIFYKMTPEGLGYRINDVEGYTDSGVTISGTISQQYISATKCGEFGCIPTAFSGAENLYECDAAWSNTTQLNYLVAGASADNAPGSGGAFTFNVDGAPSSVRWSRGCGLSSDMPKGE